MFPFPASFNPPDWNLTICDFTADVYMGTFFHTDRVNYIIRIFPLQVSLMCVTVAVLQILLKPLGETPVVAQILGGILLGRTGLTSSTPLTAIFFPGDGIRFFIETFGNLGCMIHIFLIAVKTDLNIITRSSRKEKAIGIMTFLFPLIFTVPISFLHKWRDFDEFEDVHNLRWIAMQTSSTSFPVIACFLADLKILNTELGRIATSASTISGMCSWVMLLVINGVKENGKDNNGEQHGDLVSFTLSAFAQIILIIVVLRTIVIWMIKRTPERKPIKESYIFSIIMMALGSGLIGECFGQHFYFGPMILGLVIPHGPPIGSTLEDKLETLTSAFFLPLYFYSIGNIVNIPETPSDYWFVLIPFCILSFLGKLLATLIGCYFYRIPYRDGVMLGLCLNTRGILDIQNFRTALPSELADKFTYGVMVTTSLVLAATIAPLVHFFYDPYRRYIVYKKRTIHNVKPNSEFRVLVGLYNEENVPTIVNIIEASNPTRESPITIFLLHLVELVGCSNAVLITHKPHGNQFSTPTSSDRIINGFRIYEKKARGFVSLQPFTSIAPLSIAQEDICTLALNKRTSFIILPFHRQWNIDGSSQNCKWRNANKKVLKHAPCSVGVLIDRAVLKGANRSVLFNWSTYTVGIIFLGGSDDREALFYGMRMAENQHVNVTVYRLIVPDNIIDDVTEKILDEDLMNECKMHSTMSGRTHCIEKIVNDGVDMISVIQTMETSYDLILVGRNHDNHSSIFSGLLEWNEYPELGFFGDMLASSDFKGNASILVIQQHSCIPRKRMLESQVLYKNYSDN